jgi:hypothetical protein
MKIFPKFLFKVTTLTKLLIMIGVILFIVIIFIKSPGPENCLRGIRIMEGFSYLGILRPW